MYSFHATKVFNTIEGGAVCFHDDALVQVLNDMKNFGIRSEETCEYVGGNAKMNEFQAAMGICNLRHIDEEIEKRKKVWELYEERLGGIEGIRLNKISKDVTPNYAYYPVVVDGYKYTRDEIYNKLKEVDINARKYFYPLTSEFACYKDCDYRGKGETPVARFVSERVLTLPIYAGLE